MTVDHSRLNSTLTVSCKRMLLPLTGFNTSAMRGSSPYPNKINAESQED
jgi:hypothetical protein